MLAQASMHEIHCENHRAFLALPASALAQSGPPSDDNPQFAQAELGQMLAPMALYPDELFSQAEKECLSPSKRESSQSTNCSTA